LQKADFAAAASEFRSALERDPKNPSLHYNLGLALKLQDKLPEAVEELKAAETLNPSQPDAPYTLGVTLWQMGRGEEAVAELQNAIRAKPDYAEAYYMLGTVLKQRGQLKESAEALRQAVRLQPDFAGAHTTLAGVLRQLGDNQGAAAEAQLGAQLAKQTTDMQAAVFATNSGRRLRGMGELDGAVSQFRAAIHAVPDYAPAHFELAIALRQMGKKEEAAAEFAKAAELDPKLVAPQP
jgi:tetratricopeptide (TPR) repeat protein